MGVSDLEQLIRQLGSVEIDPTVLILEIDGKPVFVGGPINIRVGSKTSQTMDDDQEWEWRIALARARAHTDEPKRITRRRRIAHGTAPLVPADDDITKPFDIRSRPWRPTIRRGPPAPPLLED